MSDATQMYKLYELLKSGQPVAVAKIAEELDIKLPSVPVYIHGLKKLKADITSVRDGRKVGYYQLTNAADVKVSEFRKGAVKKTLGIEKIEQEEPLLSSTKIDEKELADVRESLGIEEACHLVD